MPWVSHGTERRVVHCTWEYFLWNQTEMGQIQVRPLTSYETWCLFILCRHQFPRVQQKDNDHVYILESWWELRRIRDEQTLSLVAVWAKNEYTIIATIIIVITTTITMTRLWQQPSKLKVPASSDFTVCCYRRHLTELILLIFYLLITARWEASFHRKHFR